MPQKRNWSNWLPVIVWLAVIAVESSDIGSGAHTGRLLGYIWSALFGHIDPGKLEIVNLALRKTGHVVGYAVLSWLIFRAVRSAWRNGQEAVARGIDYFWQFRWAAIGVAGTLLAAAADEWHQSFNPARTGAWHDVVLDTSAAIVLQAILFFFIRRARYAEAYVAR